MLTPLGMCLLLLLLLLMMMMMLIMMNCICRMVEQKNSIKPYFQRGPLSEILANANLQHTSLNKVGQL